MASPTALTSLLVAFSFSIRFASSHENEFHCSPGDVNLGVLMAASDCTQQWYHGLAFPFAVQWAVQKVNEDPRWVFQQRNLSLGFVFADTCGKGVRALHEVSRFRPAWVLTENMTIFHELHDFYGTHSDFDNWPYRVHFQYQFHSNR